MDDIKPWFPHNNRATYVCGTKCADAECHNVHGDGKRLKKGLCPHHYWQAWKLAHPTYKPKPTSRKPVGTCACGNPGHARVSLCSTHYMGWLRNRFKIRPYSKAAEKRTRELSIEVCKRYGVA